MKAADADLKTRLAEFREACKKAGLKVTSQRLEIFSQLARSLEHPDAEVIHKRVSRKLPTVSLDTIYRNLWQFIELGLVTVLSSPCGRRRFEANMAHHHHFICADCGAMIDFTDPALEAFTVPKALSRLGTIEKTIIEFHGRCRDCLSRTKTAPRKRPRG